MTILRSERALLREIISESGAKPLLETIVNIKKWPTLKKRRPWDEERPDGYVESDRDFVENNLELVLLILEELE